VPHDFGHACSERVDPSSKDAAQDHDAVPLELLDHVLGNVQFRHSHARKTTMEQSTTMELNRLRAHLKLLTKLSIIAIAGAGTILEAHAGPSADAHQAHEAYTAAINSNKLQSLMAMFTGGIVFLSLNEPAMVGNSAVRAWCAAYLKAFKIHWDKTVSEFIVAGDWAFERYAYKQTDRAAEGGAPNPLNKR
jgi:ketosteroid isomerase-like protein